MTIYKINKDASASQVGEVLKTAASDFMELRQIENPSEEQYKQLRDAHDSIVQLDPVYSLLGKLESENRQQEQAKGSSVAGTTAQARTLGEFITQSPIYQDNVRNFSNGSYVIDASEFSRTLVTSDSTSAGALLPLAQPVSPVARQRATRLRDLIPAVPTSFSAVPYIVEYNALALEGGASATLEASAKAEIEMTYKEVTANIAKITAWIPVTTEILEDAPLLAGYINQRLTYLIALREEQEILSGAGTTGHMLGILSCTSDASYAGNIQTQTAVSSDYPATVGLAAAKVQNVDGDPNAVVVNPLNLWVARTTRHANPFDAGYSAGAPSSFANVSWGLAEVATRLMTSGTALVGDFSQGATLLDRHETRISIGNQHSDYFTTNKVAILAEKRSGLMIPRPDLFVNTTIPTS
jgi:HK97 family phage major capsid protein